MADITSNKFTIKLVNNTKRNKAKKNLDTIVNSCRKNNLLTEN